MFVCLGLVVFKDGGRKLRVRRVNTYTVMIPVLPFGMRERTHEDLTNIVTFCLFPKTLRIIAEDLTKLDFLPLYNA